MQHPLFGSLVFNVDDACWEGYHPFRRLSAYGVRAGRAEAPANLKALEEKLRQAREQLEKVGPAKSSDDDDDDDDGYDSPAGEAQVAWAEAKAELDEARRRHRIFPFTLASDAKKTEPSPQQEAAFRHLVENEAEITRQVTAALFASYENYLGHKRWLTGIEQLTALANLESVALAREHHAGVSYLAFNVDCDWEIEHGMYVVYHPAKGAEWTTYDSLYDLMESEEPPEPPEPPPPNQELVEAVFAGDAKRAKELLAQGMSINDVGPEPFPPLCAAVEEMDVDLVKRLLAVGADPNLVDFEGKTALDRARRMLKDMRPKGAYMGCGMMFARLFARRAFVEVERRAKEMVRLMEEAARGQDAGA